MTFVDYNGCAHSDDENRHDADVTIVSDFLDEVAESCGEYATENDDYTSGYDHIIGEVSHEWSDCISRWFTDGFEDFTGHSRFDDYKERLIDYICDSLNDSLDGEWEFNSCEYAVYSGSGCCLWGFDIGECEEQLSISDHSVLKYFHDKGILDDILDDVNCDLYVSRSRRREKNEETGHYEGVGRETYDPYKSDYPSIWGYHCPGGRWDFVVSDDRMRELMNVAIIRVCRRDG